MMTGEARPQDPGDDNQVIREFLSAVEAGIQSEDYDFVISLASQQALLRPFELAEYMNAKRKNEEDPVGKRRWHEGIITYIHSLSGQEFPEEEVDALDKVVESMEFDNIVENKDVAKEPELLLQDAENWENEIFTIGLDQEVIEQIRSNTVFKMAEQHATGRTSVPHDRELSEAVKTIVENVSGKLSLQMRKVLDLFVYVHAEKHATGRTSVPHDREILTAHEATVKYASDEEAALRMRSALDKYVFEHAEKHATGRTSVPKDRELVEAKKLIEAYASTPARRDAMLKRLGFM